MDAVLATFGGHGRSRDGGCHGIGKGSRRFTRDNDAGCRRHGQDRSPGGRAAYGARPARPRRFQIRHAFVRLGGPGDVGAGAAGRGRGVPDVLPGSRGPGSGRGGRGLYEAGGGAGGPAAGAVVRPGRGGGAARRGGRAGFRCRMDDPAIELVRPELQRKLPGGPDPWRRGRPAGGEYPRAVHRRR